MAYPDFRGRIVHSHPIAAALFVTLIPLPALALSVGAPQGSAWIGQPLDLRLPLTLGNEDASGALCPIVALRQGEADAAVQAMLEPGATPERPVLRVRTHRPIQEPVLQLNVKVGCQGVSAREFVLLADPPPAAAALPAPAWVPGADAGPHAAAEVRAPTRRVPALAVTAPAPSRPGAATGAPVNAERRARAVERSSQAAPAVAAQAGGTPAASRPVTARPPRQATAPRAEPTRGRLQLDALEPLPQRALRVAGWGEALPPAASPQGPGAPAGLAVAPRMGPAAAASPTLAEVERTTQLEAALAELRAQVLQNQKTLAEQRHKLAEARSSRYSNPLVYALGLLLGLAAIALWVLWRAARRAPESPWAPVAPKASIRSRFMARRAHRNAEPDDDAPLQAPVYFPLSASQRGSLDAADGDLRGGADVGGGGPTAGREPSARELAVDELYDVQQQAEFFTSLGQHEQAINALRHYVNEHPQASALAYLELLHLYHQLQRKADYEALSQQCQEALNVDVPVFAEFGAVGGRSLRDYPEAMARLRAHWPHPPTQELIEELLFRQGDEREGEAFELAAYRDLLMLYGLVQEQRFAEGEAGPALDDLLRLQGPGNRAGRAGVDTAAPSAAAAGAVASKHFEAVLAPAQHSDFQTTWPPAAVELDLDLARLEAEQIDTLPLSLKRHPTQHTVTATAPLEMTEWARVPLAEQPSLPAQETASGAEADEASKGPADAFLR